MGCRNGQQYRELKVSDMLFYWKDPRNNQIRLLKEATKHMEGGSCEVVQGGVLVIKVFTTERIYGSGNIRKRERGK